MAGLAFTRHRCKQRNILEFIAALAPDRIKTIPARATGSSEAGLLPGPGPRSGSRLGDPRSGGRLRVHQLYGVYVLRRLEEYRLNCDSAWQHCGMLPSLLRLFGLHLICLFPVRKEAKQEQYLASTHPSFPPS